MEKQNPDPFYAWLDHEEIRELVNRAGEMTAGERLVLVKGLIPGLVEEIGLEQFDDFVEEIRTKARRFEEARTHRGERNEEKRTPGERLGGPTPDGHLHFNGVRDPHREGGRDAERRAEARVWEERRGEA